MSEVAKSTFVLFRCWLPELPYAAIAQNHEHHVEFRVYSVVQMVEPWQGPGFQRKDSDVSMDTVQHVEDAEVYIHGSVKWDGCSNWHFDEQDRVMLHFCGEDHATEIGELFKRLYAWARELGQDRLDG
jgi:hypothetical protein